MIDAHCHLQSPELAPYLEELLLRARNSGVDGAVVNGTSPRDWPQVEQLCRTRAELRPSFGLHPWQADFEGDWAQELERLLQNNPNAGVGECGLDSLLSEVPLAQQLETLRIHIQLASEYQRPITLHLLGKVWQPIQAELVGLDVPILLHAFGASAELARQFSRQGCYFSLGGMWLRPEKNRGALHELPVDRVLLESDAPYQHPKGKRFHTEPALLAELCDQLAPVWGLQPEELAAQSHQNALRWLGEEAGNSGNPRSPDGKSKL